MTDGNGKVVIKVNPRDRRMQSPSALSSQEILSVVAIFRPPRFSAASDDPAELAVSARAFQPVLLKGPTQFTCYFRGRDVEIREWRQDITSLCKAGSRCCLISHSLLWYHRMGRR